MSASSTSCQNVYSSWMWYSLASYHFPQYSPSYIMKEPLVFAYYCSGHGYGHATQVSTFARYLLNLNSQMTIHIVSSAPKHVFNDSISLGVLYRFAEVNPVIVQPVVSVDTLKSFARNLFWSKSDSGSSTYRPTVFLVMLPSLDGKL
ncbi:hypothetical protein F4604DRAFT_1931233 [Suillus subluteus]|nr:hypothetical protein F4604DRAFT_1931233 [Suillus subluteus]